MNSWKKVSLLLSFKRQMSFLSPTIFRELFRYLNIERKICQIVRQNLVGKLAARITFSLN